MSSQKQQQQPHSQQRRQASLLGQQLWVGVPLTPTRLSTRAP
jgi:hypothetical protein